jgi:RNA polymerase sigma-70 factor (ECF subfamily)
LYLSEESVSMTTPPLTRPSLLVRIRDAGDREAWRQFVEVYAPLVYKFARHRGLQDADAADLTQDVLQAVAGASKRLVYDPERGTFRAWLYTVARNKLRNALIARQRRHEGGDPSLLDEQPAREEVEQWEREYEQRLFDWAAEQVRGHFQQATWRAFWMTAVEGREAADAATELRLSVGAVYIAKSRVLARLRGEIQRIQNV